MPNNKAIDGHCSCGAARYRLSETPLFVHCCHCTWCQRESGSAFVINGLIETSAINLLSGRVQLVDLPTSSGAGQTISRCSQCYVALWSYYHDMNDVIAFVRIGTLSEPSDYPPDIHIFTAAKQPWLHLDSAIPAVADYYDKFRYWPPTSLRRYEEAVKDT